MSTYNNIPLVSIIMPSFNSAETIGLSINSVINQTYTNWELLIADDASTDLTTDIIEKLIKTDPRIKLTILASNSGAGIARNTSIKNSEGKYISFLDSDDMWLSHKLEKQVLFMEENKYCLTYTYYQTINSKGYGELIKSPRTTTYNRLLSSNVIGCLTAMYNAEALGKQYMPSIRKRQDMALWLDILKQTDHAHCLEESLALYRTDTGMTQNKFKIVISQWSLYRNTLNLGLVNSIYRMIIYSTLGIIKNL